MSQKRYFICTLFILQKSRNCLVDPFKVLISVTVMETTWYKKMNRAERGADKTFCSVCRLRFLCLCFSLEVVSRASPFLWKYQALTFHICSAFSTAAKVPVNMLLFFFTSSAFTGIEINPSREKERRREGRGRNVLLQYWVLRNLMFLGTSC